MATARLTRTVDPWTDLDWIDERGPRTNHALVALLTIAAIATSSEWLVAAVALQLILGLTLGRRFCLACYLYFLVIQPRLGEGRIEDARAPRFANAIGAALTTAATVAFVTGVGGLGWGLTALVAALASFSAVTGICVGCVIFDRIWGCEQCKLPARG